MPGARMTLTAALALMSVTPAQAQLGAIIENLTRPPGYPYYYPAPAPYVPQYAPPPPVYYAPSYAPAYQGPIYAPPPPPRPSASVMEAQTLLSGLGYDPGPADGLVGPRLTDAVRSFQRDHQQAMTGRLTGETVGALREATRTHDQVGSSSSSASNGGTSSYGAAASGGQVGTLLTGPIYDPLGNQVANRPVGVARPSLRVARPNE